MNEVNHFKKDRRSIGVLIDWVDTLYHANILRGAVDYAREKGINILCFEGGAVNSECEYETQRNLVYDLVNRENVDGLIVFSVAVGYFSSLSQIEEFCRKYKGLPLVSVALDIENTNPILIDNATGLKKLLVHLIKDHNYRNFTFVTGPKNNRDAVERFEVFCATLREYGLALDPGLVVEGDFTIPGGRTAARKLLESGSIDKTDVIVAANDGMALGVLHELRLMGIHVPQDIAVVGFDDLEESAFSLPPLTTVHQPLYEQGRLAAQSLLKLIKGEEVRPKIIVPTKPVFRESCGCFSRTAVSAGSGTATGKTGPLPNAFAHKQKIVSGIMQSMGAPLDKKTKNSFEERLVKLFDALETQVLGRKNGVFLETCHALLQEVLWAGEDISVWQVLLSELRRNLLPYLSGARACLEMEDLWHQTRVMIGEAAVLKEKIKHHELLQTGKVLDLLREELLLTLDMPQLLEILATRLPELGVTGCYLSEFCDHHSPAGGAARLILAYNEQGRVKIDKDRPIVFNARRLVPPDITVGKKQHAMFVATVSFAQTQFGLVLFELENLDGALCSALHRIICCALQGVVLSKQLRAREIELIAQREHLRSLAELRKIMEGFIQTISITVEKRDPYTAGHQNRVAVLARAIATEMGLSREHIEAVYMAGIVHDLGKIYVPAEILNKPGRLLDIEFNLIKNHAQVGYDILKAIDFPWPVAQIVLQHHERLNGSGYPLGVKRDQVTLEAKILAVADVIEAMASRRPYRAALSIETALDEIVRNRGILYEPAAVDACVRLFRKGYVL